MAECPICYESKGCEWQVLDECGHIFCKDCLQRNYTQQLRSRQHTCPICRVNLGAHYNPSNNIRVFLPLKKTLISASASAKGKRNESQTNSKENEERSNVVADDTDPLRDDVSAAAATPVYNADDDFWENPVAGNNNLAKTKRKTYAALRQELEDCKSRVNEKEEDLMKQKQKTKEARENASKEQVRAKLEVRKLSSLLERKDKEVDKCLMRMRESQDRYEKEHLRLRALQLKVQNQSFFSETNLDIESIQRGLRGKDATSANALLTDALAYRNQEFNKLKYKYDEMKERRAERMGSKSAAQESRAIDNKKMKQKLMKLSEENKRLKEQQNKDKTVVKAQDDAINELMMFTDAVLVPDEKVERVRRERSKEKSAAGAAERRHGAPSFIKRPLETSAETNREPSLIFVGHDGMGGKKKVLRKASSQVTPRSQEPPMMSGLHHRSRNGGISLSQAKRPADQRSHSNLVMEHFFDRV